MNTQGLITALCKNKPFYMGVAILLVFLYHMPRVLPAFNAFNTGFIGVDFFIFFSGYSLCYSYNKHSLKDFLKRRFVRIYPTYLLFAIVISILVSLMGEHLSFFDWFCNITTLSYYQVGGSFIDWYLSSLFIFYLLFPFLYNLTKKYGWKFLVLLALIVCVIISLFDIHWWYGCAIGRLPIYVLGMLLYMDESSNKRHFLWCTLAFCLIFVVSVIIYSCGGYMRGYFMADMICPIILIIIAALLNKYPSLVLSKTGRVISVFGNNSLEIYVGNVITMKIVYTFFQEMNGWLMLLIYLISNVLIALIIGTYNKLFNTIIYSTNGK